VRAGGLWVAHVERLDCSLRLIQKTLLLHGGGGRCCDTSALEFECARIERLTAELEQVQIAAGEQATSTKGRRDSHEASLGVRD
jgi:hypothetical protein